MIRLRGRAVVYGELWFEEEPPAHASARADILVYRYRPTAVAGARTLPQHSLRTDLSVPPEALAAALDSNCRRQIRRAGQDQLRHEVLDGTAEMREAFASFYDVFAQQKGLWLADRKWLAAVAAEGRLTLTCASRGAERLVWHAYLLAGSTVQVAYSASWFRGMSEDERVIVGRANRWLHWQDMLAFKGNGALEYDWGGMFADESAPERAGINRFKRAFGGTPVIAYECTVPITLRGRAWLALRSALKRRTLTRPTGSQAPNAA